MPILNLYTCRDAMKRLNDFIDGELEPVDDKRMRTHLRICHECSKKFAFESAWIRETRARIQASELPAGMMERLSAALDEVEE